MKDSDRFLLGLILTSFIVGSYGSGGPFAITVRLGSNDVILGGSATFFCDLTGIPPPLVSHWSIGSTTPVPRSFRYSYNTPKTKFDILSVTMQDQGDYYCHAKTHDGQTLSAHAYLPVIDKFTISPQSDVVREGQAATLRCSVDKSQGVAVHWFFMGTPILQSNKNYTVEGTYQEILRVPKATRALNGTYKCYAQNSRWHFEAFPILRVEYPPSVVVDVAKTSVFVGASIQLSCAFSAQPLPTVSFQLNSKSIDTGNLRFQINDVVLRPGVRKSTLTIQKVTFDDGGIYSCHSNNKHGMKTSSGASLTVKSHFHIPPYIDAITIKVGANATISCVSNATNVDVWKFDETEIDFGSNSGRPLKLPNGDLFIRNVQFSDQGIYVCSGLLFQNGFYGKVTKKTNVTVLSDTPSKPFLLYPNFFIENMMVYVTLKWTQNVGGEILRCAIMWQLRNKKDEFSDWIVTPADPKIKSLGVSVKIEEDTTMIKFKITVQHFSGTSESNVQKILLDFSITESPVTNPTLGITDRKHVYTKLPAIGGALAALVVLSLVIVIILLRVRRKKAGNVTITAENPPANLNSEVRLSERSSQSSTSPLVPDGLTQPIYASTERKNSYDQAEVSDSGSVFSSTGKSDSSEDCASSGSGFRTRGPSVTQL